LKSSCRSLKLSIVLGVFFIISTIILSILILKCSNEVIDIILNISIGLLGSTMVALLLNIPAYDVSKRLDSDHLITLCTYHYNQAERGLITKEELLEIIDPPGSKQSSIIFFSTPTAHLNSHNYKFSVSFLENITNKRVLEQTTNTQFF
jgi:hypothetical protein